MHDQLVHEVDIDVTSKHFPFLLFLNPRHVNNYSNNKDADVQYFLCWVLWPKIRVPTRRGHAMRARACQDEGAPSREGQKNRHGSAVPRGTVMPCGTGWSCHVARSCLVIFRRLFCLAARVCRGGVSSWQLEFRPKGKNPIFQALYKEGQA